MELYRPLLLAVAGPVEALEAEGDGARVEQLDARGLDVVLETAREAVLSQQFPGELDVDAAEHLRATVAVLVAQGVARGSLADSQVVELPADALHAVVDVAQGVAAGELAKHHGDEVALGIEVLAVFVRMELFGRLFYDVVVD